MSLKGWLCWVVNIRMDDAKKWSLEGIGRFLAASEEIRFEAADRQQLYARVEQVLVGQVYAQQGKAARGLVRRYIEKITGLSRALLTRLIACYTASGRVQATVYWRRRFPQLYTRADIELLDSVEKAHETLSGPATRRILEREHLLYKRPEYSRLAAISVAHLYNLRKHSRYRERLTSYTGTRPAAVSIGERRMPEPLGQPGFLRLDTVHQGDQPGGGEKGVYHINAVDEVTQWEVAGLTPRISETYRKHLFRAHSAPVSFSHPGLPHRQRLGVHLQDCRRIARKAAHRTDQEPGPAKRRQWPSGGQERGYHR